MKKNIILATTLSIFLLGCGGGDNDNSTTTPVVSSTGYLSDSRIEGVTYTCGSKTALTTKEGAFTYINGTCSNITFTIGAITLGSINVADINSDGIVYPADLLNIDRNNTTNPELIKMLQVLQSLDSDNNPNNGITIDSATTTSMQNVAPINLDSNLTTLSDINNTVMSVNRDLIEANNAVAHYEDTLRQDLNISVDTVPPAPAVITVAPNETYSDLTSITINGEVGAQIWIDGLYSGLNIDTNHSATFDINTSNNTDVNNTSLITLVDDTNASSTATQISIFRASQATLDRREVAAIKAGLESSTTPRTFTYTQMWNSGDDYNITYTTPPSATTEDQNVTIVATITKGSASDTYSFTETIPYSQALRDVAEVSAIKAGLESSTTPRTFTYTQQWNTGEDYNVTFSEAPRAATVETQTYNVTATITKGSASDTYSFTETIPYSQALRDVEEVNAALAIFQSSSDPRNASYSNKWPTSAIYNVSFSEPKRNPTAIDQRYNVTVTITIGSYTGSMTFEEFVPTTNVNIPLEDGTIILINDEYVDAFTVTNGGLFQKIGQEEVFIGSAVSIDTTQLSSPISSSQDLLDYIINNSSTSGLTPISSNISTDGSLVARYEVSSSGQNLYELLEGILASLNYSIDGIDFTNYRDINNTIVDFYVEYDSTDNSYLILALTDKTINFDSDIIKVVNKDSVVQINETIVNEQETFTMGSSENKADFIFVIDDSGSMGSEQASVIDAIERTFSVAVANYGLDWKATVIGTENGSDYSSFINAPTENNISALSSQLDLLTTSGSDERGMKLVYQYLTNGSIVTRANSSMTIIYASDEPEHSLYSEIGLPNNTDLASSYFVQNNISYNSILTTSQQQTGELAYDMAIATGGSIANLYNYTSGYDRMMNLAVRSAMARISTVKLNYPALASSITVIVDGVKIESTTWEYDPNENAIVFTEANRPVAGANINVIYSHLDYRQIIADAKAEFDLLSNDTKRDYTNSLVNITFNPETVARTDVEQVYDVTVTFEAFGYTETSIYEETIAPLAYTVTSTTDWVQNGNSFESQNHADNTTSTLEITMQSDSTVDYVVSSEGGYDKLRVTVNGTVIVDIGGNTSGSFDVLANDLVKLEYYKDGSFSSGTDNAIVTFR